MRQRDELKLVHIASTVWFILCVGYILILELRQVGANWLVVFSLSGHGVLIVLVLVSLYLFAIFRGISSSQNVQVEHPLTSTGYYAAFYVTTPLLGSLAGCLGMIGVTTVGRFLTGIAMGTLLVTFIVWVIVDPALGVVELLLPASRKHRVQRLAEAKALRELKQRDRENLLARALAKEDSSRRSWHEVLHPQAEALARLLTDEAADIKRAEREAVGIGVDAWQTGGLTCMRELHNMAIDLCQKSDRKDDVVDHITYWWDGIGNWRATPLA
ncbi:MAG: hypothetical protein JSW59_12985 [Phycisphaerales bacterium]|nr:MAG: hypothetical protein JSW59_12985 [Phycisphaerales bacterium]